MKPAIGLLFVLPLFAQETAPLYSTEKEIAIGKTLAADIERQYKILDDPAVFEYVNGLGQALARESGMQFPLVLKVIETREPGVIALPGGFLFVSSGLIVRADTESELAGALAHAIAHIAARHWTRQAAQGSIANVSTVPLIFIGGWGGVCGRLTDRAMIPVTFQSAAREFEREADLLGLQYLYKAGYDPAGLVLIFQKLGAARPAGCTPAFQEAKQRVMRLTGLHEPVRPSLRK